MNITPLTTDEFRYYLRRFLLPFNISVAIGSVLFMAGLLWVGVAAGGGKSYLLLLLGPAGFGVGNFLGLIYASFGRESKRFGPALTAVNGAIGGIAVADLLQPQSAIGGFFNSVADACGAGSGSLVFLILVAFIAPGFLVIYINKVLMINVLQALQNARIDGLQSAVDTVNESHPTPALEPGAAPKVEAGVLRAAQRVVESPEATPATDTETMRAQAKANYVLGKYRDSLRGFERILSRAPDDPEALFYVGNLRVLLEDPVAAIKPLERFIEVAGSTPPVLKLLGYAYLFGTPHQESDQQRLHKAMNASSSYLKKEPGEPGALLNLACAHGQLGPQSQGAWEGLEAALTEALTRSPELISRVVQLCGPGQDFEQWKEDPRFQALLRRFQVPKR